MPAVWMAVTLRPQIVAPPFGSECAAARTPPGALGAWSLEFGPLTGQGGHGQRGRGLVVVSVLRFVLPAARTRRLASSTISHMAVHLHTATLLLAQVSRHPQCAFLSSSRPVCFTSLSRSLHWVRTAAAEDAAVMSGTPLGSIWAVCSQQWEGSLSVCVCVCVCVCASESERGCAREKAGYL